MIASAVLVGATLLLVGAAVLAVRLAATTRSRAWVLLAVGIVLLVARDVVTMTQNLWGLRAETDGLAVMTLLLSGCLLAGLLYVRREFAAQTDATPRRTARFGAPVPGVGWLLPLLAAGAVLVGTFTLWWDMRTNAQSILVGTTHRGAGEASQKFSDQLETDIRALDRMARRWARRGQTPPDEWVADAQRYLTDTPSLQALAVVRGEGRVQRFVTVRSGAAGRDRAAAVLVARETTLAGPAPGTPGGLSVPVHLQLTASGLWTALPLLNQDELDGYLLGLFDVQWLIDDLLPRTDALTHSLVAYVRGEELGRTGPISAPPNAWHQSASFRVGDTPFRVEVWPTAVALAASRSNRAFLVLVSGCLAAALVGTIAQLAQTARRRTEAIERNTNALRESEAGLARAQEIANMGSWELSISDGTATWSAQLYKICGVAPETFRPTLENFLPLVHSDDRGRVRRTIEDTIRSHEPFTLDYRLVRPDGEERWAHAQAEAVLDAEGAVVSIRGITQDVTGQRRMQERIQRAQKLESLEILAGGVAHDFNNLLVGILGGADLALSTLEPEAPGRADLELVKVAAQRASDLTTQMLAYSGKGTFVVEPVDLSRLVQEMARLLEVSIASRVTLAYEYAPNLPKVRGDAAQLRQVVLNLVLNASEASADRGGFITLRTGTMQADRAYLADTYLEDDVAPGAYVYLEVTDRGEGMDEDTRVRIFDPFFTTKFQGRGLGLAAVLGIVRSHHGAVRVDSVPGHGTTLRVLLPSEPA